MHNPKQMAFANKNLSALKQSMTPVVLISALGYFVDIFDLAIFGIVRISSLQDIGVPKESILDQGILLINIQMGAMVLGGFFWGSLGDRLGRRSALFASIALYSLANFLNAFISSIEPYYLLRFLAGLGLAGEVGVGVTPIAESLPPRARGYGTMLFGCIGVSGTIAAALISSHFGWRVCYAVGGALGFALLLLRVKVLEPEIFSRIKMIGVDRGSLIKLLSNPRRARTYLACLLTGVPIYYVVGLLLNLSPELAQQMGVQGPIQLSTTSMLFSAGSVLGSLGCGALSEKLKSRKRAALAFLLFPAATIFSLLSLHEIRPLSSIFIALPWDLEPATG